MNKIAVFEEANNMEQIIVPPEMIRVYRMENNLGYGPVAGRTTKVSVHSIEIQRLIRDLRFPPLLRALVGRKSPASAATHRDDWVFGITNFKDLRDWIHSWRGRGCELSVYDVPRELVVAGEGEVMFWRGALQGPGMLRGGRRHPSGLVPILLDRIPEFSLLQLLESDDAPGAATVTGRSS